MNLQLPEFGHSVAGLPSIGRALPRHLPHRKFGSGFILCSPLHFLCTQCEQLVQKIELSPIPDLQTPHRYLPESFKEWRFGLLIMTLVFPMLTLSPFTSNSDFQSFSFTQSFSSHSAMITRSSLYKSSHGQPVRNSRERASSTMISEEDSEQSPDAHPLLSLQIHC